MVSEQQAWVQAFAQLLLKKGVVSNAKLDNVQKIQDQIDTRLGQLAVLKGYITLRDVCYILASQCDLHMRFGELAVREGLMTQQQVDHLLNLQRDPFQLFLESLLLSRLTPEAELRGILHEFLDEHKIKLLPADPPSSAVVLPPVLIAPAQNAQVAEQQRRVKETLRAVMDVSTMPVVVQRLLLLLSDPDVNLHELAKVLQDDAGLAAQLLRLVNSAFFGLRNKVGNIQSAVTLIGTNGVRQAVLTASILKKMSESDQTAVKDLWRHSVVTGNWARAILQRKCDYRQLLEEAHLAGVLHEIGHQVVWQYFPDAASDIARRQAQGMSEEEAESRVLGMHHSDIGALLCHNWNFPAAITQATLYHHATPATLRGLPNKLALTDAVNLGCRLADLTVAAEDEADVLDVSSLDAGLLEYHNIDAHDLKSMAPRVIRNIDAEIAALC